MSEIKPQSKTIELTDNDKLAIELFNLNPEKKPELTSKQKMAFDLFQKPPSERPLVNIDEVRNKSMGTYEETAEFLDGTVMHFTFNKAIPYEVQEQMYDKEIISMDSNNEVKVNLKLWSRNMWKHLVNKVSPPVDETDLRTLPQDFANEIMGFVFDKWQENAVDLPEIKKNSKRTSKK